MTIYEKGEWTYVLLPQDVRNNSQWKTKLKNFYLHYYDECELCRIYQLYDVIEHHVNAIYSQFFKCGYWKYVFFPTYFKVIYSEGINSTGCEYNINWNRRDILDRNNWKPYLQLLGGDMIKPELVGFPFEEDDKMNLKSHYSINDITYDDGEEEIIRKIQKSIDEIYCSHPDLCYEFRPQICLQLTKQGENMNTNEENYIEIIQKLCDVLDIMDYEDFQKAMDKNQKLQDLYNTINTATTRFEKLRRDTKLQKRNKELIDKCLDIECDFSRKTNTTHLSWLIKDYREFNKLDRYDNSENLSKAISVEAGELLKLFNFNIGEKVCQEDIEDELGDILIYCFSLAYELNKPVDRIIARKIKKNIERNRKYE